MYKMSVISCYFAETSMIVWILMKIAMVLLYLGGSVETCNPTTLTLGSTTLFETWNPTTLTLETMSTNRVTTMNNSNSWRLNSRQPTPTNA